MANTRRENRLEELGRVDAEKAYTKKGKRNLRDEKHRIRKELKNGGKAKPWVVDLNQELLNIFNPRHKSLRELKNLKAVTLNLEVKL